MLVNRGLDRQHVVYPHSGLLPSLKEECDSDTFYQTSIIERLKDYAQGKKPEAEGQILHDSTYRRYLE